MTGLSSALLRRFTVYVGLFCLCAVLAASCNRPPTETDGSGSEDPATSQRVVIGTTLKPRTLDPADIYELAGLGVLYNLGDSLYTYDLGTTELKPQLATKFPTISPDGKTYVISVREGVTFHDGEPFNAAAMAFSLQRFIENGGKPAFLLADIVESVEATGEYELTVQLSQPFAAFPALLAFPGTCAVSPQAYTIGAGEFTPNVFVGTGPYRLAEFASDSLRLEPFPDYWGDRPANEGVDIQIYASNSANLFNAFRTGDVDIAYQTFDASQIATLLSGADAGQWQAIAAPGTVLNYMVLNRNQPPLDRKEVRQAIAALVDRPLIVERVLQGLGEPIYSLVPSAFPAYEPVFEEVYGDGDVERARALLEAEGFSTKNPVQIEVWHPSGSTIRSSVATTLKAYADRELSGLLQFEPRSVESATAFSNISKGIYPTFLVDWYPDFLDADNYVQPFLYCNNGSDADGCIEGAAQSQGSFFYSDRVNQLIEQQRGSQDPVARQELFAEIQAILAEEVPYIPLWQSKDYAFARKGIDGVTINPSQDFPFWTIAK
ncbi:ABC-type dipeptide transport system, periplasmic component [Rubidibacter lacunae KORDI 51-2]|uniref:ABC-type dipeptide transport system, periplasmic component n=1 Tax=Rubidibacter lacunae KORDI 51-2 TaxID=582515 RepID=U5DCN5_9CHRO|nr:ABC transporter substrate-binding protein [Rubidibacter lacunae]ERN42288.1 ABC-type dipeptide transport system, periplasmic component [Rubidibacter lacunae KORDI 51-2]